MAGTNQGIQDLLFNNMNPSDAAILGGQGGQQPPAEQVEQPDAVEQPPQGETSPVEQEAPQQPEQTDQPTEEAPAEQPTEVEDPGFDESQAHLFEDHTTAEPEAPAEGDLPSTPTPPPPPVDPSIDVFKQLSERLGRDVKSVDDVFEGERSLVPNFEGYSAQTSKMIDSALESGILSAESISTGELKESWAENSVDNLVFDSIAERYEAQGKEISDEAIQEEMEDMEPSMKTLMADMYAKSKDLEARQQLMEIRQQMQQDELARQETVRAQQAQRDSFFSSVDQVAKSMESIPGTPVKLTPEMQADVAKFTKSVIDLPKNHPIRQLLGNPSDGPKGIEKAFTNISRVMYAGTIHKVLQTRSKSEGIRQAIASSTQAITQKPAAGSPVGDQKPVNRRAQIEQNFANAFNQRLGRKG